MPNESNNRSGRVFIEADYSGLEVRIAAEVLRDLENERIAQDGRALSYHATTRIRLEAPPDEARGELRFSVVKNRGTPEDGVRCRLCGWTYHEAQCSCRLTREKRIELANRASELRKLTRFDHEDVI